MSNGEVLGQIARYALSGLVLAGAYAALYWTAAVPLGVPAMLANTIAFALNLGLGWWLHSRWSFRGYGSSHRHQVAYARFLGVNLLGYALNSFWVWLIVVWLGGTVVLSILPIVLITPAVNFGLTRLLIFNYRNDK